MALWTLDQAAFRELHTLGQHPWVRPVALVISDTGLGQVQATGLLIAASAVWAKWARGTLWGVALVAIGLVAARDPYPWGNGFALLVVLALLAWLKPALAWSALAAAAGSGLVRLAIMRFADRQRPSNFDFAQPYENVYGMSSFPSGHATTTFAIAFTVTLLARPEERGRANLLIGWAVLVALSRSMAGVHYPTDTLAGAALGLAGAAIVRLVGEASQARRCGSGAESTPSTTS